MAGEKKCKECGATFVGFTPVCKECNLKKGEEVARHPPSLSGDNKDSHTGQGFKNQEVQHSNVGSMQSRPFGGSNSTTRSTPGNDNDSYRNGPSQGYGGSNFQVKKNFFNNNNNNAGGNNFNNNNNNAGGSNFNNNNNNAGGNNFNNNAGNYYENDSAFNSGYRKKYGGESQNFQSTNTYDSPSNPFSKGNRNKNFNESGNSFASPQSESIQPMNAFRKGGMDNSNYNHTGAQGGRGRQGNPRAIRPNQAEPEPGTSCFIHLQRICETFKSTGDCKFGQNCTFRHDKVIPKDKKKGEDRSNISKDGFGLKVI